MYQTVRRGKSIRSPAWLTVDHSRTPRHTVRVDVDVSRLPTGSAAWLALVDFALRLGDLSEVDWLELKGTLPFTAKSDRKRSAVTLARASAT